MAAAILLLSCYALAGRPADRPCPRLNLYTEHYMIIILGLVILLAAVIVGLAGVFTNSGSTHVLTHDFAVFGYHVTGSTGTLFLYGIVLGAIGVLGLGLLWPAPDVRPGAAAWPGGAQAVPPRDRLGQPGARRPHRPARHRPRVRHEPDRRRHGARPATARARPASARRTATTPPSGRTPLQHIAEGRVRLHRPADRAAQHSKGVIMFIGFGTIILIAVIVLVVLFVRRH